MFNASFVSTLISRLEAEVAALQGKRGVVAARELLQRVRDARAKHSFQMRGNRGYRSQYQIESGQQKRAAFLRDAAQGHPRVAMERPVTPSRETMEIVPISHLRAGDQNTIARVGKWWVSSKEDGQWNNDRYSKSWHRQNGGVWEVESRTVLIRRYDAEKKVVIKRDKEVSGWRGNWALQACQAAGILRPKKIPSRLKSVQLNPLFGVRKVRQLGSMEVFERTLAGEHYDFCLLWHGLTFHADSQRVAVQGLRQKMADVERKRNALINFRFCRSLGFCEEGIRQFCADFGLDPKGAYSPDEIRAAVERDRSAAGIYTGELRKLADAVGYQHPDL